MAAATITTEHEVIRAWVEERSGFPVRAKGVSMPARINLEFPGDYADTELERVSWDEWFEAFEQQELAFLHQEETEDGKLSHFNKLLSRQSVERAKLRARRTFGSMRPPF